MDQRPPNVLRYMLESWRSRTYLRIFSADTETEKSAQCFKIADMADEITYIHMNEGCGATLPKDNDADMSYIGMHKCLTCVGLYLRILPTASSPLPRCFVAHVNVMIDLGSERHQKSRRCFDKEGVCAVEAVHTCLIRESTSKNWLAKDVDQDKTVIVCPQYRNYCASDRFYNDQEDRGESIPVGRFVVQALQKFLGNASLEPDESAYGFVVDHRSGKLLAKARRAEPGGAIDEQKWMIEGGEEHRIIHPHKEHGINSQNPPQWLISIKPDLKAREQVDTRALDAVPEFSSANCGWR